MTRISKQRNLLKEENNQFLEKNIKKFKDEINSNLVPLNTRLEEMLKNETQDASTQKLDELIKKIKTMEEEISSIKSGVENKINSLAR